ncbi:MAG TPA: LacI family DNA-binding transcriptional regulator [Micromonosporaceae bacterium]
MTIRTVARRAGVSVQTVSNVLNSPHLVRQETRAQVQAIIDELGYRASQAARQMRSGRSRLLGVRIEPARDGINGNILDRFLHELTEAAAQAQFRIVLYAAPDDHAEIRAYEDLLASYSPDGFVLTSTHHGDARTGWLLEKRVPFVTFGRPWGSPDLHPWVDVDGAAGTVLATQRLLAAGHVRVGFLGSPEGAGVADDRRDGWVTALRHAGLDASGLERHVADTVSDGERAAAEMFAHPQGPTALVCASDSLALGAWHTARLRGDTQPAVIGFDDTPVARAVGLTTVAQPLAAVAQACVRLLTGLLDGDGPRHEHVLLDPHLVVRDSG